MDIPLQTFLFTQLPPDTEKPTSAAYICIVAQARLSLSIVLVNLICSVSVNTFHSRVKRVQNTEPVGRETTQKLRRISKARLKDNGLRYTSAFASSDSTATSIASFDAAGRLGQQRRVEQLKGSTWLYCRDM